MESKKRVASNKKKYNVHHKPLMDCVLQLTQFDSATKGTLYYDLKVKQLFNALTFLIMAQTDLQTAVILKQQLTNNVLCSQIILSLQQCTEKQLKALVVFFKGPTEDFFTHNIIKCSMELKALGFFQFTKIAVEFESLGKKANDDRTLSVRSRFPLVNCKQLQMTHLPFEIFNKSHVDLAFQYQKLLSEKIKGIFRCIFRLFENRVTYETNYVEFLKESNCYRVFLNNTLYILEF